MELIQIQMRLRGARAAAAQIKGVTASLGGLAATAAKSSGAAAANLRNMLPSLASIKQTGAQFKDTGRSMTTGLSLPIAAVGAAAVVAAMKWESAFAGVRKTVTATEPELAALETTIRQMALRIPVSATELANIAEAAGQLGIKTKNIAAFTETMAALGEATNMTSTTAAEQLARFANITQMPQSQFDRLGSTVVALGNKLAATENDIVEMGMRIAGAGNQVGLTESQIMAFAGGLSSVGINAEAGGSAISQAFLKANSAVIAGGEELNNWAKVAGMSSSSFKRAWEANAGTAMISFMENLQRMKQGGQDVSGALKGLGLSGIRVQDMMMRGAGAGKLLREALGIGNEAWRENTALAREAEERYKTFESRLQLVKNSLFETGIVVGNALLPPLLNLFEFIGPKIRAFAQWFANLPGPVKTAAVAFGALLVVAGPMIWIMGQMITSIYAIGTALKFLAANPVILIIAGIAALVVGLVIAYKKVGWFRDAVDSVFNTLKEAFGPVVAEVKATLLEVFEIAKLAFGDVSKTINDLMPVIRPVASFLKDVLLVAIQTFAKIAKEQILGFAQSFRGVVQVVRGVIMVIKGVLTGDFKGAWAGVTLIFKGAVGVIIGTIRRITAPVRMVGALLLSKLGGVWNAIKSAVGSAVSWIGAKIKSIVGIVTRIGGAISSAASGMFDGIKNAFKAAINFVIRGWNSISFTIPKIDPPGPGPTFGGQTISVPQIPELFKGGIFRRPGWSIVGDRGPELMYGGAGARVVPLSSRAPSSQTDYRGPGGTYGDDDDPMIIHTHVHLNGREIATAVKEVGDRERARR